MTPEHPKDPRRNFVPRFLPWLLGLAAFITYFATINPWVSLGNGLRVAELSGWSWQPDVLNPLTFLATYPLHWLATASIPFALNLLAVVCAALTLVLLARSVAILPQDRTEAQRKREKSDFSFLTTRTAWLPPLVAVAVCGLQMTFWEQATSFTGEMFNLLVFAFIVWSLLEYRLDERRWRLFVAAGVYGAGMTDNAALIGFLPVFIGAIIWLRGLSFFNARFIGAMLLCGLAGLSLYLLLPFIASGQDTPMSFWFALKTNLSTQWSLIQAFFLNGDFRQKIGLLSLTSLLPVLLLSIRWQSSFGDSSRVGSALTSFIFHLVHVTFFAACIWVAFDPPFSPRHLGFGLPFLTFYYLAALAVGYFCGYLLLVFGKAAISNRGQREQPSPFKWLNPFIITGVWLVSAAGIAGLIYKNLPQIRATNDHSNETYARLLVQGLPAGDGFALSDDSRREILAQAMLAREGRAQQYIFLNTSLLPWPHYQRFLHKKYPNRWPQIVSDTQQNQLNPMGLLAVMSLLSQSNSIYYLHPSAGYYFEQFYSEPHGLVYKLQNLPNDTLIPPKPSQNLIAENEAFWAKAGESAFPSILAANAPVDPKAKKTLAEKILRRFHITSEPSPNAALFGALYAHGLNDWGVALQRSGDWTNAAQVFALASRLNPENAAAQINLQFNQSYLAGEGAVEDLVNTLPDPFGKFGALASAINEYGTFDVPSYCFQQGAALAQSGLRRQAVAPMARVLGLLPESVPIRLSLAQLYSLNQLPDPALQILQPLLTRPGQFGIGKTNDTQVNLAAAAAYFQKNETAKSAALLETELVRHPDDAELFNAVILAYFNHGLFTNTLTAIDRRLKNHPDDTALYFSRGYTLLQLKDYAAAITAFNRVLVTQTNNPNVFLNRGIAYLNSGKFDAAKEDFENLAALSENPAQAAFGLGEIAWRQRDTNSAIEHYEVYLANSGTNSAEAQEVIRRLQELKGQPH